MHDSVTEFQDLMLSCISGVSSTPYSAGTSHFKRLFHLQVLKLLALLYNVRYYQWRLTHSPRVTIVTHVLPGYSLLRQDSKRLSIFYQVFPECSGGSITL